MKLERMSYFCPPSLPAPWLSGLFIHLFCCLAHLAFGVFVLRFSKASTDDFGNHKIPVFLIRGIGQHTLSLKMFALLIVAKGIG